MKTNPLIHGHVIAFPTTLQKLFCGQELGPQVGCVVGTKKYTIKLKIYAYQMHF